MLTLEEAKTFLRVDSEEDDEIIEYLIRTAEAKCKEIGRINDSEDVSASPIFRTANYYALSYMYEHREDADYHLMERALCAMLRNVRGVSF